MENEPLFFNFGLIGYPLEKSLSPAIHKDGLAELALNGDYQLFPVPRLPEGAPILAGYIDKLRVGDIHGLNVTIPHKTAIVAYLDGLTLLAEKIGAVNTVFLSNGLAFGDNTDALGFMRDLERLTGFSADMSQKAALPGLALVLGGGGAARAVGYALCSAGWEVVLAARKIDQIDSWIESLNTAISSDRRSGSISAVCLDSESLSPIVYERRQELSLLVNATSAGMFPNPEITPWPDGLPLPFGAFVYDLIYKPLETRLMREARQAGLDAVNGLGMLVEQAALSFELWTGRVAPRPVMRQAAGLVLSEASESQRQSPQRNGGHL